MGCTWSAAGSVAGPQQQGGRPRAIGAANPTGQQQQQNNNNLSAGLNGNPQNRRVKPVPSWNWDVSTGGGSTPLTPTQLAFRRQTFWESQSAGRRVVWDNIKVVAEAMIAGNIELANTLLDAADIRVPHSDLSVCYDSLGQLYQVPRYAYSTPTNIVSEEEAAALAKKSRQAHVGPVTDMQVTMRLSASKGFQEQDIKMTIRSDTSVLQVKEMLHTNLFSGTFDQGADTAIKCPNLWKGKGLPPSRQRLMFSGRELSDANHMQETRVQQGSFLQVFVRPE